MSERLFNTALALTAREVKDAVRRRHPATARMGTRTIPGPWTVLEEFAGIDVLAIAATSSAPMGGRATSSYARIGYEVKVSRGDMRAELLHPNKRAIAVELCNWFYFAVPQGLLSEDEKAWCEPPEFADFSAFARARCPGDCYPRRRGRLSQRVNPETMKMEVCAECGGAGYAGKSRVEIEAPTLWVPADMGLVEVSRRGCRIVKEAPRRHARDLDQGEIGKLVRWVSARPDPRHEGLIERLREREREIAAAERRRAA